MLRITLVIFHLIAFTAVAQSFPPLTGNVATDSQQLDVEAINRASADLEAVGIEPLILFIEAPLGRTFADVESYLNEALARYGQSSDGQSNRNALTLLIGTAGLDLADDQRPILIDYGSDLIETLGRTRGNSNEIDQIRDDILLPGLQEGDFSSAIVAFLEATQNLLLPSQRAINTAQSTTTAPESSTSRGFPVMPVVLVIIAIALFFLPIVRRRSRVKRAEEEALLGPLEELQHVKGYLSEVLIDLSDQDSDSAGFDAFLPHNPEEQTDMVLLLDMLKERPEEIPPLKEAYALARDNVLAASEGLKQLRNEETEPLNISQVQNLIPRYQQLLDKAQAAKTFTQSISERWQHLQDEVKDVPRHLQELRERLERSKTAHSASDFMPTANVIFAPLEALLDEASTALADKYYLVASEKIDDVQQGLEETETAIRALSQVEQQLYKGQTVFETAQTKGFNLPHVEDQLASASTSLEEGARLLIARDTERLEIHLAGLTEQVETLIQEINRQEALHEDNTRRIAELEQAGQAAKQRIESGAVAFDSVDDFAFTSWRDIQGHGSEAQHAADRAFDLWQRAKKANDLSADHHDLGHAADCLDEAFAALAQVETLISAIEQRLADLDEAQHRSRSLAAQLSQEITRYQDYVQQVEVDRLVGEEPENALQEAEQQLHTVHVELNSVQPDYLKTMRLLSNISKQVETAFQQIQKQEEAMHLRQERLRIAEQRAKSALNRLEQYYHIHQEELPESQAPYQLHDAYSKAKAATNDHDQMTEDALAQAMHDSTQAFESLSSEADQLFQSAEREFQHMQRLRGDVAQQAALISATLNQLSRYVQHNQLNYNSFSLRKYEQALQASIAGMGPQELEQTLVHNRQLDSDLKRVFDEARRLVRRNQLRERDARRQRQREEERREEANRARDNATWGFANSNPTKASWGHSSHRSKHTSAISTRFPQVSPTSKKKLSRPPASSKRSSGSWKPKKHSERSTSGW